MSNVTAKVASRFLIGVAAAAVSISLFSPAARAADNCQTEPGSDNPQGKHWYYRIERGTGRHCWYLRVEAEKSARADEDKAVAERPAPRKIESATSHSIADAHAEIAPRAAAPDSANTAAAPSVWPNPPAPAAGSGAAGGGAPVETAQTASPWPQAGQADTTANSQPEASLMAADSQPEAATDSQDSAASPLPPPPVERNIGSIQKLALVAAGALALAGLTGSAVYRLGRRRRDDWLRERTAWQYEQNPHRPPWVDEPRLYHADPAVADLDDPYQAEEESDFSLAMQEPMEEPEVSDESPERIEDFLARLTRQLHDEMEGPRPQRA